MPRPRNEPLSEHFSAGQAVELQLGEHRVEAVVRRVGSGELTLEPPFSAKADQLLALQKRDGSLMFSGAGAKFAMPTTVLRVQLRPLKLLYVRHDEAAVARIQRRRHFRVECEVRVIYAWQAGAGGSAVKIPKAEQVGMTHDVSAGGVLLDVAKPYELGTRLQLQVFLEEAKPPLLLAAQVVRHAVADGEQGQLLPHRVGLEFEEISEAQRNQITRVLHQRQVQIARRRRSSVS